MASGGSSLAGTLRSTTSPLPVHVPRLQSTLPNNAGKRTSPSVQSSVLSSVQSSVQSCLKYSVQSQGLYGPSSARWQRPRAARGAGVCRSGFLGSAAGLRAPEGGVHPLGSLPLALPRGRAPATWQRQRRRVSAVLENSSGMGGSMHEDFDENDKGFVPASLLPATEVKSGSEGFTVKLADGSMLRCAHNHSEGARLPDYAPQPAMVLKLEDGSDILLPLIVLEHPRSVLIEALKNVPLSRPTVFLVIRDMIELMGFELKLVRITHRVGEAYYARIYLAKVGDESGSILSLDLRPSDAINLAVRAKVPIQVNKALAVADGVRQVSMVPRGASPRSIRAIRSYHFTWTEEDRPDTKDSWAESEFAMVQMMEQAAQEERFADAARIRDQLRAFRGRRQKEEVIV